MALAMTRRVDEEIILTTKDGQVLATITIKSVGRYNVHLDIEAPQDVKIFCPNDRRTDRTPLRKLGR